MKEISTVISKVHKLTKDLYLPADRDGQTESCTWFQKLPGEYVNWNTGTMKLKLTATEKHVNGRQILLHAIDS